MDHQNIYQKLCEISGADHVLCDEPMSRHTTFRIGGPADFFVMPSGKEELKQIKQFCQQAELPLFLLGNGSNLLVGDGGVRGVVLDLEEGFCELHATEHGLYAGAGVLLSRIARKALELGLTGLEFAAGIPGTLGGAVVMNAGAYGGEMKDVLEQVLVLDADGTERLLNATECELGYRTSCIQKNGYTVLGASFVLREGDKDAMKARMEELAAARKEKQPLEFPSAGSTFKRPEGYFAGKLIQDAGLKGFTVGGAQVSEKHSGFVINRGGATAKDVVTLCEQVSSRVCDQFGVTLEMEIKKLGEFE